VDHVLALLAFQLLDQFVVGFQLLQSVLARVLRLLLVEDNVLEVDNVFQSSLPNFKSISFVLGLVDYVIL